MDVDSPPPPEFSPGEPRPIIQLEEDVVNKIAAGEIIQRPANCIKELIENCLDAGATSIKITVKDGGLKLLQIQDDGCGVRHADLPILCQRFTTSKLRTFEDLESMSTYGFRGEALASVSHVAHVSVLTKTKESSCAWKAHYANGVLVAPKPGETEEPKSAAGNQGTTIIVEDLFFNTPARLRALKSANDELSRILDVVTRYAVHNPTVAFVCKKAGASAPTISTPSGSTVPQTIKLAYGQTLARELVHLPLLKDEALDFQVEGWLTGPNWSSKKPTGGFLAFINHRSVDSPKIKKAIDSLYGAFLPKGTYPWVYLSLQINPKNIDVNVHPTKKEVRFINEDEIVEAICERVQEVLAGANSSRTYSLQVQSLLPGASDPNASMDESDDDEGEEAPSRVKEIRRPGSSSTSKPKPAPSHKVRVDPTVRTLDSMFAPVHPSQLPNRRPSSAAERSSLGGGGNDNSSSSARKRRKMIEEGGEAADQPIDVDMLDGERGGGPGNEEDDWDDGVEWKGQDVEVELPSAAEVGAKSRGVGAGGVIKEVVCNLTSIKDLRAQVVEKKHSALTDLVQNHKFVGIVDYDLSLSAVQHSTKLYLVNHAAIAEELFHQLGLLQFGAYARLTLEPPPDIRTLLATAIKFIPETELKEKDRETKLEWIYSRLLERREMLEEYFKLNITEDGKLQSIPLLLKGYFPNMDRLPMFLLRLGPGVDWTGEAECFSSFLRELAFFYVPVPTLSIYNPTSNEKEKEDTAERKHELYQVEHVIFPAIRKHLLPPKSLLTEGDVVQMANLPDLYKVFERC